MKRNQNNNISFGDYDNTGSRKLLPILLVVLILLAVAAGGYFGYKFVSARRNAVVSIEVTSPPTKYIYWVGQEIDYTGLEVTATCRNGKAFVVDLADCVISGYTSDEATTMRYVSVEYENCYSAFSVEIREKPKETPVLKAISFKTLPKTQYKVGEWLNTSGGILVYEYFNQLPLYVNLTNDQVWGWEKVNAPGTYDLTVKYKENGIIATTTYTITVTD